MDKKLMYKIRYADINDAKVLGEIHSRSWKTAYKGIVPDLFLDNITAAKREEHFIKVISENSEEDILIFINDNPVGLMTIGRCRDNDKDSTYGEIWGIYLLPEYWNKGIGSNFISWGMNELKKRNYKKITLWVLEDNLNARKFYERMGFRHDGTLKELDFGKRLNEFRYEKVI